MSSPGATQKKGLPRGRAGGRNRAFGLEHVARLALILTKEYFARDEVAAEATWLALQSLDSQLNPPGKAPQGTRIARPFNSEAPIDSITRLMRRVRQAGTDRTLMGRAGASVDVSLIFREHAILMAVLKLPKGMVPPAELREATRRLAEPREQVDRSRRELSMALAELKRSNL